jgi:hypothetical protein
MTAVEKYNQRVEQVFALNLSAGDVIQYTMQVQQRLGAVRSRTYLMEIASMESHVATGINLNSGKTAKAYLADAIELKIASRKVAA